MSGLQPCSTRMLHSWQKRQESHSSTPDSCAAGMDRKRKLQKLLGIEGTVHAGIALGMPSFRFDKYIDKKEVVLKRID